MSQTLHLDYTCTPTEKSEAETLHERQELGQGSKWRTWVVLSGLALLMALELYVKILREIPLSRWPIPIITITGLTAVGVFLLRRFRRNSGGPTKIEVTESDVTFLGPASRVTMPWSAFSRCIESPNLFVLLSQQKTTLFIMPKRAFPSESWQTWFRSQASDRIGAAAPHRDAIAAEPLSAPAGSIVLRFKYGFGDYLAYTVASWRVWGMLLFMAMLMGVISIVQAFNPPPDAVNSSGKVFFEFELPFLVAMVPIAILVFSTYAWLLGRKHRSQEEYALSEQSISFSGKDGSGTILWDTLTAYKETRWSFIIWRGFHGIMLLKRAFSSHDEIERCRALLARHLKRSRWFFG